MNREERSGYEVMRDERDIARDQLANARAVRAVLRAEIAALRATLDDWRPYLRHDEGCRFDFLAALPCSCGLAEKQAATYPEERSNGG